jgi:phytoene dehydrogenase-like protein
MCADSKLVFVLVQVGGRVQSAASPDGTFRFDTGPSLLLFPDK